MSQAPRIPGALNAKLCDTDISNHKLGLKVERLNRKKLPKSLLILTIGAFVAALFVHYLFVTYFTGSLFSEELFSQVYDSLAAHLLKGEVDVDPSSIGYEGFAIDGKTYTYHAPFPALLRIVLNSIFPSLYSLWPRVSCLVASLIALLAFSLIMIQACARNPLNNDRRWSTFLPLFIFTFGCGTPLLFLVSCSYLYHEAVIWGLAGSLISLECTMRVITRDRFRSRWIYVWLGTCAGVTLLSRFTFAIPYFFIVPALVCLDFQHSPSRFLALREIARRSILSFPFGAALVIQLWYNYARFNSLFTMFSYKHFYIHPELIGGEFNLRRIPSALINYFWIDLRWLYDPSPYIHMPSALYLDPALFFNWREQAISLSVASCWLVLLAVCGAIMLFRHRSHKIGLVVGASLSLQFALILCFFFVTERYAAEFLPLLVYLMAVFLRFARPPGPVLSSILFFTSIFSLVITPVSILDWHMRYNGASTREYKLWLSRIFQPRLALPDFGTSLIYLSDLEPISIGKVVGQPKKDRYWDGGPIWSAGETLVKGLGVHAETSLTYAVPKSTSQLQGVIGLADNVLYCDQASLVYKVINEKGEILFNSPPINNLSVPLPFVIDLNGATTITLALEKGGESNECGHGYWGLVAFVPENVVAP